jgi:hypothetical protein
MTLGRPLVCVFDLRAVWCGRSAPLNHNSASRFKGTPGLAGEVAGRPTVQAATAGGVSDPKK